MLCMTSSGLWTTSAHFRCIQRSGVPWPMDFISPTGAKACLYLWTWLEWWHPEVNRKWHHFQVSGLRYVVPLTSQSPLVPGRRGEEDRQSYFSHMKLNKYKSAHSLFKIQGKWNWFNLKARSIRVILLLIVELGQSVTHKAECNLPLYCLILLLQSQTINKSKRFIKSPVGCIQLNGSQVAQA